MKKSPPIVELMIRGSKYDSYEVKDLVKKMENDKEGTIQQLREKLMARLKGNGAAGEYYHLRDNKGKTDSFFLSGNRRFQIYICLS